MQKGRGGGRWVVAALAGVMLLSGADAPKPKAAFDSEKVGRDLDRVQKEIDGRRRLMDDVWPKDFGVSTAPGSAIERAAASQNGRPVAYRFAKDQALAYRVEIELRGEGGDKVERYAGTPYVAVRAVDDKGTGEMYVMGRLACTVRRGDGPETARKDQDIWIGSRFMVDSRGNIRGARKDVNLKTFPDAFETLKFRPKELLFPRLPRRAPALEGGTGTAQLLVSQTEKVGLVNLPSSNMIEGYSNNILRADLLAPPLVKLQEDRAFLTNEKVKPYAKLAYRSVGRFDADRGALFDLEARFRVEVSDRRTALATIRVARLEGADLRKAYDRSLAEWADRPAGLEPVELLRQPVAAKSSTFLKTTRDAAPGLAVIHFDEGDNRYYRAEVVSAESSPNGNVTIRYRGSGEELSLHPRKLALPPEK